MNLNCPVDDTFPYLVLCHLPSLCVLAPWREHYHTETTPVNNP
jgi:hypothetical protein